MKVTVIGGGSTYTPELVQGFLERVGTFPLRELWLMDIDAPRLEIVGGFAQRIVAAQDADDRIIYDTQTGALYYDPDGIGGTAAVALAVLGNQGANTAADFEIVA